MRFNKEFKVIIDTLRKNEAKAFVKFLKSEILRHEVDIQQAYELIKEVRIKFKGNDADKNNLLSEL